MSERILENPGTQIDQHASLLALEVGVRATQPVVLIPAYQPEAKLLQPLVEELSASGALSGILLVDDGGGPRYRELFHSLARLKGVSVLTHIVNLGKGSALKTGMNHAACYFPDSLGVVTADADGQHSAADILKVAAGLGVTPGQLVMGARGFDANVPFRSRFGNTVTRCIMRAVTGQKLGDTQSGLRGIPLQFIPSLLKLRATGYDFELDMLVTCKDTGRPIREIPIATIYIENNRSSHFNPLRDSMRIYFVFIRFLALSLGTAAIDNGLFIATTHFWPNMLLCQAASRLVAGTFQFSVGKRGVFHSQARIVSTLWKYWMLVAFSGVLSYLLIQSFLRYTSLSVVPAKLIAETVLFFLSFIIQRDVVFAHSAKESGNPE
jgi:putative flippase GtrA